MRTATDYLGRQYDSEKETRKFLHRYEAQAGLSNRQYAKRMPIRYVDWTGEIPFHQEVQTEPYIEMFIPQHRFEELVDREKHFEEMASKSDYAQHILAEKTIEDTIRRQNPAVEKAWRNYKMLLELARQ